MRLTSRASILLAVGGLILTCRPVAAVDVTWTNAGVDDYSNLSNWSTGQLPEANFFNERGVINNGGTAVVNSAVGVQSGGLLLGNAAANSGTLRVMSGGVLENVVGTPPTGAAVDGQVIVGVSGTGKLEVQPGGSLSAAGLTIGGNSASSITIGGSGAGTANVTINGPVNLNRTVRLGHNAHLTTASPSGFVLLQATGKYIFEVDGASYATVNSSASAFLDGRLSLEFISGTPTASSTWNLFDAPAIGGSFDSIEFSQDIPLAPGLKWVVDPVPGGAGRVIAQLRTRQHLVLTINRDTGEAVLSNPGANALSLDAYSVRSAGGWLTPGTWSSLDDQNTLGGDWLETNSTVNRITELKPSGSATLTSGVSRSLGPLFNLNPPAFGMKIDDLTFDYTTSDGAEFQGLVEYVGSFRPNNLLLTVDPSTGIAQVKNTSNFTVSIDSYSVLSESGALDEAGWNSLDQQNISNGHWLEAESNEFRLTEVQASGVTTLVPNATLDLGALFATTGDQDLQFEFLLEGASEPMKGVVHFSSITVPGDFDQDGDVDGTDLTHPTLGWKSRFGVGLDGSDFLTWQRNFGAGVPAQAATAAVPEPNAVWLGVIARAVLSCIVGRKSRMAV